jgi:RNA polymerase sigma factor (sigma-70 family)
MVGLVCEAAAERARMWYEADDAADLAQDVAIKFWQAWTVDPGLFDAENLPIHWIGVAVRNGVISRHRAQKTREFAEVPTEPARDEAIASGADSADQAEAFELGRHLAEALNALSQKQREVFFRIHDRGESYREAASGMGLSTETVKAYLSRANQLMRAALVRYDGSMDNE